MKLPGAVQTGVRGLAHMPSNAAATLAKGQAVMQSANIIAGTLAKIDTERTNEEVRQLNMSLMQDQADFDLTYNKDAYTADEIPEGIEVRLSNNEVVDGQNVSVPREDIPAYEVKADIYRKQMMQKVNAGAERITNKFEREQWLEEKTALVELNTTKLIGQAESDQREYNAKKLSFDINSAVDEGRYDIALALTSDIKNAEARVSTRKEIKTTKELNDYDTLILTKDDPDSWVQIEEDILKLRDPEQQSTLTNEQRVSEADKLERALHLGKQDYAIAQKEEVANAAADIKVDLDHGSINYNESDFKKQRDSGLLTNSQYIGYTKQLNDNKVKLQKSQKAKFEIQAGYINPKNNDHMKAVDDEFTRLAQESDPWTASQQVVQKYNVLPPAVNNAFNMANITGGENLTSAAVQYSVLNETNPIAMMNVKAPRVQQVAAYMELGMNPAQALESLALNESLSPAQIETRKGMVTGRDNMDENTEALSSMFSDAYGSWYNTPDTPIFMAAEFSALTEANLSKSGFDIDVARRMAFNTVKGKYKPTEINGSKQVLPYMPQQPDELVRKQIKKQLGDDVIIQSDQLTENQVMLGNEITYMAYKDLGDGNIELLDRYEYDPQSIQNTQAKDQEAKQKKAIEDAIKEREQIALKKKRIQENKDKNIALEKSYQTKLKLQRKESSIGL
jgi:hypothetical protein